MRTLLMILVVSLAFLVVRCFSPRPVSVAGDEERTKSGEVAHFLVPPPAEALPSKPSVDAPVAQESPEKARETAEGAAGAWPANLLSAPGGSEDEVRVAAALVHGTPAEVQAAAASLVQDRALLLESFSWAVAGERQMALSLSEKVARESIEERERALFEAALTGRAPEPASASSGPVSLAMEIALLARGATQALAARRFPEAARGFSALLVGELQAPWRADRRVLAEWTRGLEAAQHEHRWSPRSQWPAVEMRVERGDSLIGIRLRYLSEHPGALLCTGLIERANRVKGFLQPGQLLKVPTDPVRVLVDLEACWALFLMGDEVVAAWPVGIGRVGEATPPGDYAVRNKLENPPWMKEGQEPIPFGDPRNPLGTRWIGWSREGGKTSYGFHGTWEPDTVGQAASDGCVRLLNEDVEELFQILPEGAPVEVRG